MLQLRTVIDIHASADQVWRVLTDFSAYREWNPYIISISGELRRGARLKVRVQPPAGRSLTFRPTVLVADQKRELRWLGRLLFPGIFEGEHAFQITPLEKDQVRFVQHETFRGLLVPLLRRWLNGQTRAGFVAMDRALKERAECRA
ncbi:MAG: SRPBCC domain-containing protein [Candidatus Rokubacteria bacterium]|nr:SRPBCC domain-containing protein [Candidatus Rokubacteria bacterium]